jgi:hypothetical protein
VEFTQVPAGKRLIITSISCVVRTAYSKGIHAVKLGDSNGPPHIVVTAPYTKIGANLLYEDGIYEYYSADAQIYHVFASNKVPLIGFEFTGPYLKERDCTIGGRLQNHPLMPTGSSSSDHGR